MVEKGKKKYKKEMDEKTSFVSSGSHTQHEKSGGGRKRITYNQLVSVLMFHSLVISPKTHLNLYDDTYFVVVVVSASRGAEELSAKREGIPKNALEKGGFDGSDDDDATHAFGCCVCKEEELEETSFLSFFLSPASKRSSSSTTPFFAIFLDDAERHDDEKEKEPLNNDVKQDRKSTESWKRAWVFVVRVENKKIIDN